MADASVELGTVAREVSTRPLPQAIGGRSADSDLAQVGTESVRTGTRSSQACANSLQSTSWTDGRAPIMPCFKRTCLAPVTENEKDSDSSDSDSDDEDEAKEKNQRKKAELEKELLATVQAQKFEKNSFLPISTSERSFSSETSSLLTRNGVRPKEKICVRVDPKKRSASVSTQ